MDDQFTQIRDALTASTEGALVTRWIAIAEVVHGDGERYLESYYPADTALWDQIGMLRFALADRERWINDSYDDDA